ncbi:MAG: site-specific tyrosine recombinase XerC [Burkholderiaceae bacterium]|jgi:integrase/recombinase XerD|nr:site-specific tyrosine recombinase XerC [Burkholderiaceae bacterium]
MRSGARPYQRKPDPRRAFASIPASGAPGDLRGLMAAMHRYLEHLGVKGYTPVGQHNAERYIREFIAWADARGVTHPTQVSRAVLERYQRWLHHYRKRNGEPLALISQRGKIIPLRGWFKWLTRVGEIPANPAADLDLPRQIKQLPRGVMSATEAERVLASVDTTTPLGLRDRALMEVLYATGMRRMEIAHLAIDDIDAERAVVLVRQGKGQKDRLIPLGQRALRWVRQYLDQAREQLAWNPREHSLFLGNEGHPLSPLWLSTLIARRVQAAGIDKRGGCHLWRHTMATLMLEGGADIRHIQAMLGHADISSTQIYAQVAIGQLQRVHARTHPGVNPRPRGATSQPEGGEPRTDRENAARALLEALGREAEAQEEEGDDAGGL